MQLTPRGHLLSPENPLVQSYYSKVSTQHTSLFFCLSFRTREHILLSWYPFLLSVTCRCWLVYLPIPHYFFQYPFFFLLLNKGRIFYDHDTPIYFCNFRYWLESLSTTTFFSISILPSFPHFSPVLMVVHIVSVSRKRNNFGAFRVYITHRRQHILRKHLPLNIY